MSGVRLTPLVQIPPWVSSYQALGNELPILPKQLLLTSLVPSACVDNQLIAEHMTGLEKSLSFLYCPPSIRTQQYSRISLDGGGGPGPILASGVPSTIKWGSDIVSKLKWLIHSAKPSGAVTKMSCQSVCPLYFKVENPLTRQLGGKSMVCSMVNKAMFVGAVVSAIDLPSNGALFSTAVLNVAEALMERLKLNEVLCIYTSPAT